MGYVLCNVHVSIGDFTILHRPIITCAGVWRGSSYKHTHTKVPSKQAILDGSGYIIN